MTPPEDRGRGLAAVPGDPAGFPALLAAAQAGEEQAWALLFEELAGPVTQYLRLRGAEDPEDLNGEVFLRVARSVATFAGDGRAFRSWVFTIAHRLLLDDRRRRSRRPLTLVPADEAGLGSDDRLAGAAPPMAGADVEAARRFGTEDALALLARLTADQRDVILLRVLGELGVDEVAAVVGKEPNAVRQLQHRGLATLRRLLAADAAAIDPGTDTDTGADTRADRGADAGP